MRFKYHNIYIYIAIFIIFSISGCKSESDLEQTPTIKVIEANSNIESESILESEIHTEEAQNPAPIYYNSYKINLDVDTDSRTISGVEKLCYKNNTGTDIDKIYFHLYLNAFSSSYKLQPYFSQFENKIFKYGKDTGIIDIKSVHINNEDAKFSQNGTILEISLSQTLKDKEETEITLQFASYIPKIAHRTGSNDKAIWLGNYIPTLCKYDDTGWRKDEYYPAGDPFYSDISNYEVKVTTPKEYEVIGTGDETVIETEQKKVTTLNAELVRDFAFAISKNFKVYTLKMPDNLNINFYHYSDDIFDMDSMMEVAQNSIKYYNDRLGSYPYSELDIVETELFFNYGGMEYPGFVMMDSGYLKKQESINSIAHEIGHQWLYNIIGNDQINEAWLDEGVNSYLQQGIFHSSSEIDKIMENEYNSLKQKLKDSPQKTLNLSLDEYDNWASYYNTQYIRAKLMIYSLNRKMGDEMFAQFLKTYYKKYNFKIATKYDFIATAEEVYGSNLHDFFNMWINSEDMPQLR